MDDNRNQRAASIFKSVFHLWFEALECFSSILTYTFYIVLPLQYQITSNAEIKLSHQFLSSCSYIFSQQIKFNLLYRNFELNMAVRVFFINIFKLI